PLMDRARSTVCQPTYQHVVLGPGASQEIGISGAGVGAGSDTLSTGRYYVAVVVDRIHDLLTVPAGAVDFVSPLYGLTFAATTSVSGGNLVVHATMTDTTARPIRLEYGACAVQLLAYRTADRTGRPVWNSAYRAPYGISNSGYGCPAYLAVGTIKPGQTLSPPELNPSFRIIDMLADSLPNGHYYFNAAISMNWRDRIVSAGEADVSR
ncbi:MAG TPA: hypothetical protein VHB25_18755, partial [Gemmatimonadaceae bacterium]|nr:hypothetical protein [Gemmatimonadaceae bacterium]